MLRDLSHSPEQSSLLEGKAERTAALAQHVVELCHNPQEGEKGKEYAEARALLVLLPPYFSLEAVQAAVAYVDMGREVLEGELVDGPSHVLPSWFAALYAYHHGCVSALFGGEKETQETDRTKLVAAVRQWQKELSPEYCLDMVRELRASGVPLQDAVLDVLLGIRQDVSKLGLSAKSDWELFVAERTMYASTPYAYVDQVVSDMSKRQVHSLMDIGSGTGRMLLYGSSVINALFVGVEVDSELVQSTNIAAKRLSIAPRAVYEDALRSVVYDTEAVYMYNPFQTNDDQVTQQQTRACITQFLDHAQPGNVLYGFGYSNSLVERFVGLQEDEGFSARTNLLNPVHSPAFVRDVAYRPRKFIVQS